MTEGALQRKYYKGFGAALTVWRNEWFTFDATTRMLTVIKGKEANKIALQRAEAGGEPIVITSPKAILCNEELEVIAVRDVPDRAKKRAHRFDFVLRSTWKVRY
jgi:hypothetical protein